MSPKCHTTVSSSIDWFGLASVDDLYQFHCHQSGILFLEAAPGLVWLQSMIEISFNAAKVL